MDALQALEEIKKELIRNGASSFAMDRVEIIRAAIDASGWMPIETAPRDGDAILVTNGITRWILIPEFKKSIDELSQWLGEDNRSATHWMPLPAPPKNGV